MYVNIQKRSYNNKNFEIKNEFFTYILCTTILSFQVKVHKARVEELSVNFKMKHKWQLCAKKIIKIWREKKNNFQLFLYL